ncbi:MAG: hypothetical protein ABI162_06905 [Luteolibacter sp.]
MSLCLIFMICSAVSFGFSAFNVLPQSGVNFQSLGFMFAAIAVIVTKCLA